jgi:hypothetical protein
MTGITSINENSGVHVPNEEQNQAEMDKVSPKWNSPDERPYIATFSLNNQSLSSNGNTDQKEHW